MALIKSDDNVELAKAVHHHIGEMLDLLNADGNTREAARKLSEMLDGGSQETLRRATELLSTAQYLHSGLKGMASGGGPVDQPSVRTVEPVLSNRRGQVSKEEERRSKRADEILRAAEGGYSWLDELLYKNESGEPVVRVLAREINARLKKASDTRTPALEDPEGQAIYALHRALVGHGSEVTVFQMREALRKGTDLVTQIENMTPEARKQWMIEHPEQWLDYVRDHHARASMGGDVG